VAKKKLEWPATPTAVSEEFSVGTVTADVNLTEGAAALASWKDSQGNSQGAAIVKKDNGIFFTWAPGQQGDITVNPMLLSMSMDDLVPGISQQAAVQISFADFQTIGQELEYLTKRTQETINTAKQADLAVPFKVIQQNYEQALSHVKSFEQ